MTLADLADVERAEELFARLGVPFDPAVLSRARFHVLRLCGAAVAHAEASRPDATDAERLAALADALRRAHDLVAREGAVAAVAPCAGCSGPAAAPDEAPAEPPSYVGPPRRQQASRAGRPPCGS